MNTALSLLAHAFIPLASAQVGAGAGVVAGGGGLVGAIGTGGFGGMAVAIANGFVPLVTVLALLVIVASAVLMIVRQDEGEIAQLKTVVGASLAAIILVNVVQPIADIMGNVTNAPSTAASGFNTEVLGIISFIEVPLGVVAVLMIIVSGVRAVISYGREQGTTQLRRTVFAVVSGVILIVVKVSIAGSVTSGTPGGLISPVINTVNLIAGGMGLVAVAIMVYAGFMMILNVGNDDQYARARSLIVRVGIGLVIIIVSIAIVNALAIPLTGGTIPTSPGP